MASDIDICNLALMRLGTRSSISSLDEGSTEANLCALIYPVTREALLNQHSWGFATRRVVLADLGSPPGGSAALVGSGACAPRGWAWRYAYPSDCLQARAITPMAEGTFVPFEVAGDIDGSGTPIRVILTNQSQAELVYTARVTSAALFDAQFAEALSWMMAAELAMALTGDKLLADGCMKTAAGAVAAARANDANEAMVVRDRTAEWIAVRGGYGFTDGREYLAGMTGRNVYTPFP